MWKDSTFSKYFILFFQMKSSLTGPYKGIDGFLLDPKTMIFWIYSAPPLAPAA